MGKAAEELHVKTIIIPDYPPNESGGACDETTEVPREESCRHVY
jgi:hypothetical protein